MQSPAPLLNVEQLTMRFGGLTAVDGVSMQAHEKQVTAIIGPNGAGKTTLFNCLTGFYQPTEGQITLTRNGHTVALAGLPAHIINRHGIARTFQNIRLFGNMTALENLLVAQNNKLMPASGYSFGGLLHFPGYVRAEKAAIEKARYWLDQMRLLKAADRPAGELPYGMQRRLEIARALCTDPCLLCLDEPAAGLNSGEAIRLRQALAAIREEHKIGVLLIEHNMSVVMEISDQVYVLDYGKRIATGSPAEVRHNPAVIRAYLGEEETGEAVA
ncbi:MAG: ATP-binding cassette domain-containing protein [Alphaproteobacteria bacterium]|nr:ATP-binding cassette domain-containing protein [Alphaproteobacteria bacterium]MBV8548842.1 ATP-binding cassette domain-containing protein [Alphaproteobacteria bacterium]